MVEFYRNLEKKLKSDSKIFRIVTLQGPRQSGKTTIARRCFPNYSYVSLENIDTRSQALEDARTFLKRYRSPVIIDEVQRVPELLSYIQEIVDANPDNKGQFILTGSHQPLLRETISQSLAGRTSLLTLYPLSLYEVNSQTSLYKKDDVSHWIYRGFMPEIYRSGLDSTRFHQAYSQTYVERDIRQILNIKEQQLFEKFIKLLAGRIGQLVNFDSLASDVGVSSKTVKEWISVLEASFIIFRLHPYFKNIGKRLVKTPKVYFVDVGLASYLLGIESAEQVSRDPLFGQLFENLVISDIVKSRLNQAKDPNLYFYRDKHGNEIDLISEKRNELQAIESKRLLLITNISSKILSIFALWIKQRWATALLSIAVKTEN